MTPLLLARELFEEAAQKTRLGPRSLAMARRVLIDGQTAAAAGRAEGASREAARMATARVMRSFRELHGLPRDWEVCTISAPRALCWLFRVMTSREYARQGLEVDPLSLSGVELTAEQAADLAEIVAKWREVNRGE